MLSLKYLRGILQTSGSKCQSIVKLDEKSGPRKSARADSDISGWCNDAEEINLQRTLLYVWIVQVLWQRCVLDITVRSISIHYLIWHNAFRNLNRFSVTETDELYN